MACEAPTEAEIGQVLASQDIPPGFLSFLHNVRMFAAVADRFDRILAGHGSDELFAGYRRYLRVLDPDYQDDGGVPRIARARSHGLASGRRWQEDLYAHNFRAWAEARDPEEPLRHSLAALGSMEPLDRLAFLEAFVEGYAEMTAMLTALSNRYGVKVVSPFLSPEFVVFAGAIPARWKAAGGQTKAVVKRAMEGFLPGEIVYAPKLGFDDFFPHEDWVLSHRTALWEQIEDGILCGNWVDRERMRNLVIGETAGSARCLWRLYAFERWYRALCVFRAIPTTHSDSCRPPIPSEGDHQFQPVPTTNR